MNWVGRWGHVGAVRGRSDFAGCRWIRGRRRFYDVIQLLGLSRSGAAAIGWREREGIGERNRDVSNQVWVKASEVAGWI
jgi:hypothetical protein